MYIAKRIRRSSFSLPRMGAFDHLIWSYDGDLFKHLFGGGEGNLNVLFSKIPTPRGFPGGGMI